MDSLTESDAVKDERWRPTHACPFSPEGGAFI